MKNIVIYLLLSSCTMHLSAQRFSVLKDIKPGTESSFPGYLMIAENKLFFSAEDSDYGDELWMSDGTGNTTKMVVDLNPGKAGSFPQNLIYMNGAVYFTANDGTSGKELWKLTLSTMALQKLTNTNVAEPFMLEDAFIVYHNNLYFSFDDGTHGNEVWKTNGTVAGTMLVKDMRAGTSRTSIGDFFIFKNKLYYRGEDDIDTQALYEIDDLADTSFRFFNCGENGCSAFTTFNNELYFFSDDQIFSHPNNELYVSDGTEANTHIVKEINPNGDGTYFGKIAVANNEMFFAADDGLHGIELWKSNGTANGTQMVKDITPGSQNSTPTDLISYNNKVIFKAYQNGTGGAWATNGTTSGTIKLADILINSTGRNSTEVSNKLVFVGYVNGFGYELCMTDGTPSGTKLALDINKGAASSFADRFTIRDSTLFFAATDDKKGDEVFFIIPLNFTSAVNANSIAKAFSIDRTIVLSQNTPNPFTGTTLIQYMLPKHYKKASLIFSEQSGRIVKIFQLSGSGANSINITSENFSPGIYFYSLVVDDRIEKTRSCLLLRK